MTGPGGEVLKCHIFSRKEQNKKKKKKQSDSYVNKSEIHFLPTRKRSGPPVAKFMMNLATRLHIRFFKTS